MINIKHLFITLHTYCNFNCTYCWQRNNNVTKVKMTPERVLNILDYFYENYFAFYPKDSEVKITLSGGEGLLFADEILLYLQRIHEYNSLNGVKIITYIQTNGSFLNRNLIKQLAKYNVVLQISYDGAAQNLTREQQENIFNNIIFALNNKIKVRITSIYTPLTISYIYDSFLQLIPLNIEQWAIGLDFLQKKSEYNLEILEEQFNLINSHSLNFPIKNFEQFKQSKLIIEEITESIYGISVTPYGEYLPINYIYTSKKSPIFGNDSIGLNNELVSQYIAHQEEKLITNHYIDHAEIDITKVISNLLNFDNL